ncbi:MAG: shikimate kinase [Candidatus Thermoplasmatota archaeon]
MGRPVVGIGQAHGAVTILNATATGIGCALAVEAGAFARWSWKGDGLVFEGETDDRLARAVQQLCGGGAARVQSTTAFAPARGLKTSSSAATAMLRAAHAARAADVDDWALLRTAVAACRQAGVTLTGALDDQAAVTLGGCHLTDNRRDAVLQALPAERWHVAVWVPDQALPKGRLHGLDLTPVVKDARAAEQLAARGNLPAAMTRNGEAYTKLYAGAGLPVNAEPAAVALTHGALGAGLSGTGPAVAALFEAAVTLPDVAGGAWTWTRAVEAPR